MHDSDPRRALEEMYDETADLVAFAQEHGDLSSPEDGECLRQLRDRSERGAEEMRAERSRQPSLSPDPEVRAAMEQAMDDAGAALDGLEDDDGAG